MCLVSRTRWDETDGIASPIVHRYILHFFLEDGTVEMRELADIKGGRELNKQRPTQRPSFHRLIACLSFPQRYRCIHMRVPANTV